MSRVATLLWVALFANLLHLSIGAKKKTKKLEEPLVGPETYISIPIKSNGHGALLRMQIIDTEKIKITAEVHRGIWFATSFGKITGGTDIFICQEKALN
jgi:hypothetical protein